MASGYHMARVRLDRKKDRGRSQPGEAGEWLLERTREGNKPALAAMPPTPLSQEQLV